MPFPLQTCGATECDAQTLLLCCWRASKEVSLLLADIIQMLPHDAKEEDDDDECLLDYEGVKKENICQRPLKECVYLETSNFLCTTAGEGHIRFFRPSPRLHGSSRRL
jgi:hypothetical protein